MPKQRLANCLLGEVKSVDVNPVSADLRFRFDGEVVLEVVNDSSGYECWILNYNDGLLMGRQERVIAKSLF